jgi:hypothetical protein
LKISLVIKSETWNKDSNELFDYECSDLIKSNLITQYSGYLVRIKDEIKFFSSLNEISKTSKLLFKIDCNDSQFFLINNFEEKNNIESAWLCLRYTKSKNKNRVKLTYKIGLQT